MCCGVSVVLRGFGGLSKPADTGAQGVRIMCRMHSWGWGKVVMRGREGAQRLGWRI